ncbi:MAG: glycosyl transferase [Pseudomonadota bacterium]|nr:glycosyl transferase [Pseudomonadota bacterium]
MMFTSHPILLTVVIPFRNFDRSAKAMLEAAIEGVAPLVDDYELIVVDNGSSNEEFRDYQPLLGGDGFANIQIYRLLQQVDNDVASIVGIENSLGDYVLVYDPRSENLSQLGAALDKIAEGCEVVFLRNLASTDHGLVQRIAGPVFRWGFQRITRIDLVRDAALGRLMSKRVISYLLDQPNPVAQYRTFPMRAGFVRTTLVYSDPRADKARRTTLERIRSAMRLVVANSMMPIRLVSLATLLGALLNLAYSAYVVLIAIVKRDVAPGWVTLSLQQSGMFFLFSMILFVLTEYMIHTMRWNMRGTEYFIDSERTSAVLSRRQKLNVERAAPTLPDAKDD